MSEIEGTYKTKPVIIIGNDKALKRFIAQKEGTDKPEYPEGQLNPDDQGELAYAIYLDREKKTIMFNFNKNVSWLGLDIKSALAMHAALTSRITELSSLLNDERRKTQTKDNGK